MRNIIHIIGYVCLVATGILVSCSKESAADKMPVITGVRLIDPAYADSTFTECVPGTNIILMGRNLASTYEIYINDQKVTFQGTFVTDKNILLTVPSDIKFTGNGSGLRDEIRVVTREGVAVYPFHINAWGCSISAMEADFPLQPGQEIVLYGANFIDVEQVYYTNVDPNSAGGYADGKEWWEIEDEKLPQQVGSRIAVTPVERTELAYSVGGEQTELHVTLPAALVDEAWIVVRTYTGQASIVLYRNSLVPEIGKINSDMPIVGSTVKVDGEGFVGVYNIGIGNNEIVIPVSDIKVSPDGSHLEFKMPEAPEYGGKLIVRTSAGSDEVPFYDVNSVIADMDGRGGQDWGGATQVEGKMSTPPYVTTGKCLGIDVDLNQHKEWGAGRMAFNKVVMPSDIPDSTPLSRLELRYEGFYIRPFDEKEINFVFEFWWDNNVKTYIDYYKPASIYTGDTMEGEWATYSIPVTDFVKDLDNYGEWLEALEYSQYGGTVIFHPRKNTEEQLEDNVQFYIDNVRIYVRE